MLRGLLFCVLNELHLLGGKRPVQVFFYLFVKLASCKAVIVGHPVLILGVYRKGCRNVKIRLTLKCGLAGCFVLLFYNGYGRLYVKSSA